ncbi:hypothetical protein [Leadbettera azotonutricia]|nr:hypothetical protein [Leadbettera azotonutricia]
MKDRLSSKERLKITITNGIPFSRPTARQWNISTETAGTWMAFLDMLVNETELNCVNPLEEPPMGM